MADPRDRDPISPNPADPQDPAGRPRIDPVTGAPRPAETVVVNNTRGGSNALVLGVIAAAIVVALLVFMNWTPATDTAVTPDGAVTEEPAATTDGAVPPAATTEPATEAPATTAPAETTPPAGGDTAPAPADEAPATQPAPAE